MLSHRANIGNVTGTSYTVKNLPEGADFEFRVVPVNASGQGEPSEPTDMTKVKKPQVAPKIGYDAPREVIATYNEPFKIRVPYTGGKLDEVLLSKNGIPVNLNDPNITVTITPDEAVIAFKKASKTDQGPYGVILKNSKGQDKVPVNVHVMAPPGPPEGPLEVRNIHAESCSLYWKPPDDTGGSPVTSYIIDKMDTRTGEWTPVTKFARGPPYEVVGLDEGVQYKFRVRAGNEYGAGEPLETQMAILAADPSSK
ncbi:unnamed protein product [Protopolystoma xenopodis]|uniref:Fibronectin type-III domain-containing protein n=1 Tax=Protopolystoma xenopodis TaxID=117903 RepID=A0A448WC53_9PLAT|nr:unnamed protein product [Protopolystoma xenopodis]